eukprot:4781236-Amphidinium_carterae.1
MATNKSIDHTSRRKRNGNGKVNASPEFPDALDDHCSPELLTGASLLHDRLQPIHELSLSGFAKVVHDEGMCLQHVWGADRKSSTKAKQCRHFECESV